MTNLEMCEIVKRHYFAGCRVVICCYHITNYCLDFCYEQDAYDLIALLQELIDQENMKVFIKKDTVKIQISTNKFADLVYGYTNSYTHM